MHVTIEKPALAAALDAAALAAARRGGPIPILSHVLLRAETGEGLVIAGTNLEQWAIALAEGEVAEAGAAAVPFDLLRTAVAAAGDGSQIELRLDAAAGRVTGTDGRRRWRLPTLPVEDFPARPEAPAEGWFTLEAADLRRLIHRTAFAISTEATRYYLCGLHLILRDGALQATATDGHRLGRASMPAPDGCVIAADGADGADSADGADDGVTVPTADDGVIVPTAFVRSLEKMCKAGQPADLNIGATRIQARCGDARHTSQMIAGTFPDADRVIPRDSKVTIQADGPALAAAVRRVEAFADLDKKEKARAIAFDRDGDGLVLRVVNEGGSAFEEPLDVEIDGDMPERLGFNARFITAALDALDADTVSMAIYDAGSPALFRSLTDADALAVVMPMRLAFRG